MVQAARGYKARAREADITFNMGKIAARIEDEAILEGALATMRGERERIRRQNQTLERQDPTGVAEATSKKKTA